MSADENDKDQKPTTDDKTRKAKSDKEKKSRKNPNFLSYEEAKAYIQTEMIESRRNYEAWFQRVQPKALPRFPYRVYKEWVSWNDFLGVNNKFIKKRQVKWRIFDEAVKWAHTLKLKNQAEWTEFARSGAKPDDIPMRPDVAYAKWVSWNHWLGNKPSERVKVANADEIGVFYVIQEPGFPSNVLRFGIEPGGLTALRSQWERSPYKIIRFFKALRSKVETVNKIVEQITTPYYGYPKHRITPNVWDIIWYIEQHLEPITDLSGATVASVPTVAPRFDDDLIMIEDYDDEE